MAALGICLAWLELIFLFGRYPFSGGIFSCMYYNIIRKLTRYLFAVLAMGVGKVVDGIFNINMVLTLLDGRLKIYD